MCADAPTTIGMVLLVPAKIWRIIRKYFRLLTSRWQLSNYVIVTVYNQICPGIYNLRIRSPDRIWTTNWTLSLKNVDAFKLANTASKFWVSCKLNRRNKVVISSTPFFGRCVKKLDESYLSDFDDKEIDLTVYFASVKWQLIVSCLLSIGKWCCSGGRSFDSCHIFSGVHVDGIFIPLRHCCGGLEYFNCWFN